MRRYPLNKTLLLIWFSVKASKQTNKLHHLTGCIFQIKEIVFLKNTVMECEACGELTTWTETQISAWLSKQLTHFYILIFGVLVAVKTVLTFPIFSRPFVKLEMIEPFLKMLIWVWNHHIKPTGWTGRTNASKKDAIMCWKQMKVDLCSSQGWVGYSLVPPVCPTPATQEWSVWRPPRASSVDPVLMAWRATGLTALMWTRYTETLCDRYNTIQYSTRNRHCTGGTCEISLVFSCDQQVLVGRKILHSLAATVFTPGGWNVCVVMPIWSKGAWQWEWPTAKRYRTFKWIHRLAQDLVERLLMSQRTTD